METNLLIFFSFTFGILRVATPLILASLAGLISERSGVIQIALEGMMLIGALAGAIGAHFTDSAWIGFFIAGLSGLALALIKSFFVLRFKTDQIVTGTAINIFAAGLAPLITKLIFDSTGQTPALDISARFAFEPIILAIFAIIAAHFILTKTRFGLWNLFAGESPESLAVAGVSTEKIRWISLMSCGFLAGLSGGTG